MTVRLVTPDNLIQEMGSGNPIYGHAAHVEANPARTGFSRT